MKNYVRLAIAAAVAVGATSGAFAQALPSSGASDLWVFVTDPGATGGAETFAWDTGISLTSLTPSTLSTTAKATTNSDPVNIDVTSTQLAAFIAGSPDASALQWAAEGVQYTGAPSGDKAPGVLIGVTSNNAATSLISNLHQSNLGTWGQGFNGDLTFLTTVATQGYAAGGTAYPVAPVSGSPNVWGAGTGNVGGSTNLYGQGPNSAGTGIGATESLYLLTGSNSLTAAVESYTLGASDLTLSTDGTLSTPTSPVPIPAAVWLFGSGLLGLMGVGRRRVA
ncbi:MAG TPA: VPLPA-CTERM sorting domain-containing protein [Steroidobacteraceae bacterium]|nr:VPLPA-CTERM sorting domain-containing protein [Steroidobacteraceae bacterium]